MIWLYTGTPGSGKSLHAARQILQASTFNTQVIANFALRPTKKQLRKGKEPIYWDNEEISVKRLLRYSKKNHKHGVEGQALLVIDECQIMFNCRAFNVKGRNEWVNFFSQHRKFGYNIILITQYDRMIDRQIRAMVEYQTKHRCINNRGIIGQLLTIFRIRLFVAIEIWYGMNQINSKRFYTYRRRWANIYDSYANFEGFGEEDDEDDEIDATPAATGGTDGGGAGAPPAGTVEAADVPKKRSLLSNILWRLFYRRNASATPTAVPIDAADEETPTTNEDRSCNNETEKGT